MSLAVISCHFNPAGYRRPVQLAEEFIGTVTRAGIPLAIVELVFPDQPGAHGMSDIQFAIAAAKKQGHRVLHYKIHGDRAAHTLFQKEPLLNKAAQIALAEWKEITALAWLDADIVFEEPHWARTLDASLRGSDPIVQAFSTAIWERQDGTESFRRPGCIAAADGNCRRAHPGFAWAASRSFWDRGPGLFPFGITGGGDTLMARPLLGLQRPQYPLHSDLGEHLFRWTIALKSWLAGRKCSHAPLTVRHRWHGSQEGRKYRERAQVLQQLQPTHHLRYDHNKGLVHWTENAPRWMRDWLATYFAGRAEDGAD